MLKYFKFIFIVHCALMLKMNIGIKNKNSEIFCKELEMEILAPDSKKGK